MLKLVKESFADLFKSIFCVVGVFVVGGVWLSSSVQNLKTGALGVPLVNNLSWDSGDSKFLEQTVAGDAGCLILVANGGNSEKKVEVCVEGMQFDRGLTHSTNPGRSILEDKSAGGESDSDRFCISPMMIAKSSRASAVFIGSGSRPIVHITDGERELPSLNILSNGEVFFYCLYSGLFGMFVGPTLRLLKGIAFKLILEEILEAQRKKLSVEGAVG